MAWVNWDGTNTNRGYIGGGQNGGIDGEVFTMGKAAEGSDRILFLNLLPNGGQGNSITKSPAAGFSTGTWHQVAYTVHSSNGTTLYLDGDGLSNGVEAWFGSNPRAFNPGLTELSTSGLTTTFGHPRNPNAPSDLTGNYEWSTDMVNWYPGNGIAAPPGGPTVNIVPSPATTATTVTATASQAMPRLFLRARVARN